MTWELLALLSWIDRLFSSVLRKSGEKKSRPSVIDCCFYFWD